MERRVFYSLGGVTRHGVGGGREMMDVRRAEALSGAVAVSMAGLARSMWISALKMAL